jgi:hypothetical protein
MENEQYIVHCIVGKPNTWRNNAWRISRLVKHGLNRKQLILYISMLIVPKKLNIQP